MKTLKEKVEYCLKNFPDTRNSDITLLIRIWRMFHVEQLINDSNAVKLKDLYDLPREDDIKRSRAIIQNGTKEKSPEFVPIEWVVAKARGWEKDKWKFYREQDFATGIKSQTIKGRYKYPKQDKLLDVRPEL